MTKEKKERILLVARTWDLVPIEYNNWIYLCGWEDEDELQEIIATENALGANFIKVDINELQTITIL